MRSPHLYRAVRLFCLGAFAQLAAEQERGAELEFAFEQHATPGRPALYAYRPLVHSYIGARADRLAKNPDARLAIEELRREPAAAIFTHGGPASSPEQALFHSVLLPLLVWTVEACGGFDWEDGAFERVYQDFERSLSGASRSYAAVAPLVGLSASAPVDLARGIRVLEWSAEALDAWPEERDLVPARFGAEPERRWMLALERELRGGQQTPPDAPAELADAVTALRLATAAPVAAGPVVFEQVDRHPLGIRTMLGIAATEPAGEPTRLDPWRGRLAGELLERLGQTEDDSELAEATERWELSLFEGEPLHPERLRESLAALLGGVDGLWAAATRASVLLGEANRDALILQLRSLARGESVEDGSRDVVRRAIVETLLHEDRQQLILALDDALLGLRPRPAGYFAARARAS